MENSNDIKSIDIEERLNPSLTNATVNIVTYTFRMKYGKKYFEKFLTTPHYMSSSHKLRNYWNKTINLIRTKQTNIIELVQTLENSDNIKKSVVFETLSMLLQIIPAIAVNIEVLDPIIIEINKDTLKTASKIVNNFKSSPIRPIIILLLDKNTSSAVIEEILKKLPIDLKVAIHKDSGETEVITVLNNIGADSVEDFMDSYSSQCFCTCCHTKQSILIRDMKESNIVSILSTLLIKCHSYLLQDNKKSAQEDIKYIHSLLTHSYIESDLLKMFTCILSLYNVYATDKGGTSILTAINLSRELNNPLMEAFVDRFAHFIPNTSYKEKSEILLKASEIFNKKNVFDHKIYCINNMLTYSFYSESLDTRKFNDLLGEATSNVPWLAGMSILYNNAGTAELYNRNPDIALIRYKEGLDYARANNRPAQRIGLMGNIIITESLLGIKHDSQYFIRGFNDIINMPNTRNLPFIQANGMMNFLASAIFEKNFEAVKEITTSQNFKEVLIRSLRDNEMGTGSLIEQLNVLLKKSQGHLNFDYLKCPSHHSIISGIRHNYISENGFNPAIGNAWL